VKFRFDRQQAMPPVRVSWRLSATTVAGLEKMAQREGATVEQVAQQVLDHVVGSTERKAVPEAPREG
jgi:hypothetical protein